MMRQKFELEARVTTLRTRGRVVASEIKREKFPAASVGAKK